MKKLPLLLVAFLSLVLTTSCENEPLDPNIVAENPNTNPNTDFHGTLTYENESYDIPRITIAKQTLGEEESFISYTLSSVRQVSTSTINNVQIILMTEDTELDAQMYTLANYVNYGGSLTTITVNPDQSVDTSQEYIFNFIDEDKYLEVGDFEVINITDNNVELDFTFTNVSGVTISGTYSGPYDYVEQNL
ncbi:hypothetical protein [Mesonia sp. K7]|uniref:hypothetical protein n=1 Tax=Mesonia sp. K7 TaxID=2218606 RepID=UPI000DA95520|nr:hypothetical protein [Mesonia sp. K7]PZD77857.1 hypothetical protein DNG35_07100 [Mesonia sp. K7]